MGVQLENVFLAALWLGVIDHKNLPALILFVLSPSPDLMLKMDSIPLTAFLKQNVIVLGYIVVRPQH